MAMMARAVLLPSETSVLNIDLGQQGVGGDNSWGNPVHVDYRMLIRAYKYGYKISPMTAK